MNIADNEYGIYYGDDIRISKSIVVKQPTMGEIRKYGEKRYFNSVHTICGVGADFKWQLADVGLDYTKIPDYDLFLYMLSPILSSKKDLYNKLMNDEDVDSIEERKKYSDEELSDMLINPMELILDGIDFNDFEICVLNDTNENILYNEKDDITIDRCVYSQMVDVIRQIHGIKRNNQIPANERTRLDLIEDARDDYLASLRKPYRSALKPLTSTLIVKDKLHPDVISNMHVNMFFDIVKRTGLVQDAELILQGAYSGFGSLKGIDRNKLNIFSEI